MLLRRGWRHRTGIKQEIFPFFGVAHKIKTTPKKNPTLFFRFWIFWLQASKAAKIKPHQPPRLGYFGQIFFCYARVAKKIKTHPKVVGLDDILQQEKKKIKPPPQSAY